MEQAVRKSILGLAVFQSKRCPPVILGEDGETYGWHLPRPVETAREWPRIQSVPGGIWYKGARLFNPKSKALQERCLREGDVVRLGRRIGVVVCVDVSCASSFVFRLFGFATSTASVAQQAMIAVLAGVSGTPALILGPTGTGKECMARVIHGARTRVQSHAPFVAMNLGGLSNELCASELFGHERGAFTGADRAKEGAFRSAARGVLFLDELGEASQEVQTSLLRALDHGEIRPVGRSETFQSQAQVIAATNREPGEDGSIEGIRFDLVQRVAGFVMYLPPLVHRPDDILPLAEHFLSNSNTLITGRRFAGLSHGARALLQAHQWSGNVRELRAVLKRALLLNVGFDLGESTMEEALNVWMKKPHEMPNSDLSHLDREVLRISRLGSRQRGLARRRLGIPKTTFYRRLRFLNEIEDRA